MIYFIQSGNNGPIKIGYTENGIERRLAELQTASPYKLNLICYIEGSSVVERELHNEFDAYKTTGEWFTPSPELNSFIEGLKKSEFNLLNTKDLTNRSEAKKKIIAHKIYQGKPFSLRSVLKGIEKESIIFALEKYNGHQQNAAYALGMTKSSMSQKIKYYQIDISRFTDINPGSQI